jgi:type II secretory pathway component PulL
MEAICNEIKGTVHSYKLQENAPLTLEKIFFGESTAAHPYTEKFLSDFFKMPAERIDIINTVRQKTDPKILGLYNPSIMNNSLANTLRKQQKGRGFNFRRDEFEAKRRYFKTWPDFKKSAILFVLLIALLFSNTSIGFYNISWELKQVEEKYEEERLKRFPESKNYKYPHIQLKQKLAELENSSVQLPGGINPDQKVLDLLKDISQRISGSMDVDVSNIIIDLETIRISGETDSFNTVDGLKNRLDPSSFFTNITISSANVDRAGQRVKFDLKLTRSKQY